MKSPVTLIAGAVSAIFIGAAMVVVLALASPDFNASPYVATILGTVGLIVPSLLALYKAETLTADIHNGLIATQVTKGLAESPITAQVAANTEQLAHGNGETPVSVTVVPDPGNPLPVTETPKGTTP